MIAVGDKVRSFDFQDYKILTGDTACYVEGEVVEICKNGVEGIPHCPVYKIAVERRVFGGVEIEKPDFVYPPVNGTPSFFGKTDGVELIHSS